MLPASCQKILFSATYSDEVMDFAGTVVPQAVKIRLKRNEESLDNIKQVLLVYVHIYKFVYAHSIITSPQAAVLIYMHVLLIMSLSN